MIQRSLTDTEDPDQHRHGHVGRTGPACSQRRPLLQSHPSQAHLCSSPQWPSPRTAPSSPVLGSEGRSSESVETERKENTLTVPNKWDSPQWTSTDVPGLTEHDKPPALPHVTQLEASQHVLHKQQRSRLFHPPYKGDVPRALRPLRAQAESLFAEC